LRAVGAAAQTESPALFDTLSEAKAEPIPIERAQAKKPEPQPVAQPPPSQRIARTPDTRAQPPVAEGWKDIPPSEELLSVARPNEVSSHDYPVVVSQSVGRPEAGLNKLNTQRGPASKSQGFGAVTVANVNYIDGVPAPTAKPKKRTVSDQNSVPEVSKETIAQLSDQYQSMKMAAQAPLSVAFEWLNQKNGILDVEEATLSLGGDREEALGGWDVLAATDYLTTLSFRKSRETLSVPMLANNTRRFLETLRDGLKQGQETGLIFGDMKPGWDVLTTGESEDALFLTEDGFLTEDRGESAHFVLFNAQPGRHRVTLRRLKDGQSSAAIVVPVQPGQATYLDLTDIREASIDGRVLDASDPELAGIVGSTIRALGHSATRSSGEKGWFELSGVLAAYPYPMVLETALEAEWPHRYEIAFDRLAGVELFRLSAAQIEVFGSQIGDDLQRSQHGVIIGAFRSTFRRSRAAADSIR
jgi:hypothetical protein